jgi:hypothetical protein
VAKLPVPPPAKPAAFQGDDIRDYLQHCNERLEEMRPLRECYWATWEEISRFITPTRGRFDGQPPSANRMRGRQKTQAILNRKASKAHKKLGAFLMTGISSKSRNWFELTINDPDLKNNSDVKLFLDMCSDRIRTVLASSNFYQAIQNVYEEIAGFGTAAAIIFPDYENIIHCYTMTAGEYMLAVNDKNIVDTVYREFVMTSGAMKKQFGYENLSDAVRSAIDNNKLSMEFNVVHVIEPNIAYDPRWKLDWRGKKFVSVYYEWGRTGEGRALSVRGSDDLQCIAPRWQTISTDVYGRGPSEDILPDTKSLQVSEADFLEAVAKMVKPPVAAPASMMTTRLNLNPNAVNVLQGNDTQALRSIYDIKIDLNDLTAKKKEYENSIDEGLFGDLIAIFNGVDNPQMTATEVKARQQEQMYMLGPMLESFHTEALSPIIDIVFGILAKAHMLPPIPKELAGKHIEPNFVSMLAQAQRAINTTSIEALTKFAGGLAGISPGVMDNVDLDEAVREYGDLLGVPAKIMRDKDLVDHMRADRAQQAAQQQAQQQSMAAVQGAATLSQTKLGNGQSALDMMAGIPAGGGGGGGGN